MVRPYIILFNAFLFLPAFLFFGGWAAMVVVFMPYIAIPVALVMGAIAYLILETLGRLLLARDSLSLLNLLAACAVVCLPLGFLPSRIDGNLYPNPFEMLLEDYVVSLVFYSALLQIMGASWWLAYRKDQDVHMKSVRFVAVLFVAAMPYILFALAQTSRLHDSVRSNDMERIISAFKPWKFVDGRDRSGNTPLQLAVARGNLIAAKFFLDRGASVWPRQYRQSQTDYLDMAVSAGDADMAKLLLDHNAPVNSSRAICSAVQSLKLSLVELLLKHGADPNAIKKPYQTMPALRCLPNARLADSNYYQIVGALLEYGANINYYDSDGHSLFSWAMYRKPVDAELLRFLITKGTSLGAGPKGGTPLRYAARAKLVDVVKLLLEAGADANDGGIECRSETMGAMCQTHTTALHEAVELYDYNYNLKPQSVEITAMLLVHGANPNVLSEGGRTPLFMASYTSNHEAVALLLKAGANPTYDAPPDLRRQFNHNKNTSLTRPTGVKDAVKRGLLRPAVQDDMQAWIDATAAKNEPAEGAADSTKAAQAGTSGSAPGKQPRMYSVPFNSYVVLKPFVFPAGLFGGNLATFFIPKGVEKPSGDPGHSAVFDFNTLMCTGPTCGAYAQ